MTARVGHHAQLRERCGPEGGLVEQPQPQRRYRRHHGDALGGERRRDLLRQGRAFHHERGAGAHGAEHLAHAVHETERQQAGDAIVPGDAEVGDDGPGGRAQVAVTHRDALGEARRAGRVDDLGDVAVAPWPGGHGRGADRGQGRDVHDRAVAADGPRLPRQQVGARNEMARAGVRQDVLDLPRPQRLVQYDGDAARRQRPEERRHGVGAALQQDRDRPVGPRVCRSERRGDGRRARDYGAVARRLIALHDGGRHGIARRRAPQQRRDVRVQPLLTGFPGHAAPPVRSCRDSATSIPRNDGGHGRDAHRPEARCAGATPRFFRCGGAPCAAVVRQCAPQVVVA